ncbi:MAG: GGDEF domain-containing protein [Planctomycetota bacterium]|nr:GGDEF domain-containing protein [Planctomycetota bacterium]
MPQRPGTFKRPRNVAQWASQLWGVAGLIGLTATATVALLNPFPDLRPATTALIAVACGWAAMLLLAPWAYMARLDRDRRVLRQFTRRLKRINVGQRDDRINALLLDRDDDLGELSRTLHATLVQVINHRRESRLLQRTMDDAIRRETDRATVHLKREATTDALTGLGNRRELERQLAELFGPDRRQRRGTVVAMVIDMDHFKTINDTLGHETGDDCLAFVGELLSSTLRSNDCAIRHGGDEFVVLMPDRTVTEAEAAARRVQELFAQMPWPHRATTRPTLSIGIASAWCGDPAGETELIRRADAALYHSKSSGRDRVTVYDDHRRVA